MRTPPPVRNYSLIEVMFAVTLLAIVTTSVSGVCFSIIRSNQFTNDQSRSFKAAHQTLESLLAIDIDEVIAYDGKSFSDVHNRTASAELTTWSGELDQGFADVDPDNWGEGDAPSFEPVTRFAASAGTVRVQSLDASWQPHPTLDPSASLFRIEATVEAFGVSLAAVRTRY